MSINEFNNPKFRELYKKTPITFPYVVFPKLLELLGDIKGKKVLDLGCGWGNFSLMLANKGANVTGIDISKERIEECKKLYGDVQNINFSVGDASNLINQKNKMFDVIIMNMVFIEIESKEKIKRILDEVSRVIKKEGVFLFTDIHPADRIVSKTTTREHKFLPDFSYFKNGTKFKSKVLLNDGSFIEFTDFNWTLETYTTLINEAGFYIYRIIEPKPIPSSPQIFKDYPFPKYLLFCCKKF